jgi:hypothetical protein
LKKSEKKACHPVESQIDRMARRQEGLNGRSKKFEKSEKKACHRCRDWIIRAKT